MLIDKKKEDEEGKSKVVRALKRRKRRLEAFVLVEIMSFEGTYSAELLDSQDFVRVVKEVEEGSFDVVASSLRGVTEVVEARMTATSSSECL